MLGRTDGRTEVVICRTADWADCAASDAVGKPFAVLVQAGFAAPAIQDSVAQESFAADLPAHRTNCVCCGGRSAAALALDRLFQRRVRGQCAWFNRVMVLAPFPSAAALVTAALREDPLTSTRFRAAGPGGASRGGPDGVQPA
jgi:sugar lactone lactonase YvrE